MSAGEGQPSDDWEVVAHVPSLEELRCVRVRERGLPRRETDMVDAAAVVPSGGEVALVRQDLEGAGPGAGDALEAGNIDVEVAQDEEWVIGESSSEIFHLALKLMNERAGFPGWEVDVPDDDRAGE